MLLTIIIISYNTKDLTLACIESIYEQESKLDFNIIVLDNNSADGSADAIAEKFPGVNLIRSVDNVGFAPGNNICAKQVKSEYILLLNPDTVVLDNAIDKLIQFAEQFPYAGIWGGKTLYDANILNPTSCWREMSLWNLFCRTTGLTGIFPRSSLFNSEAYGDWDRNSIREVDIVTGCFFLIKTKLWNELGGFNPKFFMYGEEADLCLRASRLGYQPMVTNDATIIHYGGKSETEEADKLIKLLKGKVQLLRSHWGPFKLPLGLFLIAGWPMVRTLLFRCISIVSPIHKSKFEMWNKVRLAKTEWLKGYE